MGTNFYCKKPISKKNREMVVEQLNALIKEVENECNNINLQDIILDYGENIETLLPERIHLGKRSHGWQFLWNYHNGKYFDANLNSIKVFLEDKIIYNEYGRVFSLDGFLNEELGKCLYNKDGKLDDGMNGNYRRDFFLSNGLRFSKFENFS